MKNFFKIISNLLICVLIFLIIFFGVKSFYNYYNIDYIDVSQDEIHNFMMRNSIKLKDSKRITNVTMQRIIPSGYTYTIYYIDSNNKKQSEKISIKSEMIFKEYMIEHGENLEEKYSNVCKIALCMLAIVIVIKSIIIYIDNKKHVF